MLDTTLNREDCCGVQYVDESTCVYLQTLPTAKITDRQ